MTSRRPPLDTAGVWDTDATRGSTSEMREWPAPHRVRAAMYRYRLGPMAGWALAWLPLPGPVLPGWRVAAAVAATGLAGSAIGELRAKVLLEDDGVAIARAVGRRRILWTDVRGVRMRGLEMGRGWVEVVRQNGREVVLPAPVEAYPALRASWERATGVRP